MPYLFEKAAGDHRRSGTRLWIERRGIIEMGWRHGAGRNAPSRPFTRPCRHDQRADVKEIAMSPMKRTMAAHNIGADFKPPRHASFIFIYALLRARYPGRDCREDAITAISLILTRFI